jgi:SAM-dependent methyltransferase
MRRSLRPAVPDAGYAGAYDEDRFGDPFGRYLRDHEVAVFRALIDASARTVLDLGAGTGKLSQALRGRACRVVSADLSPEMLRVARRRAGADIPPLIAVVCAAHRLPFRDRAVDCLVSSRMLMHVSDWRAVIAEMCRVTLGAVIIDFPPRGSFSGAAFAVKGWAARRRGAAPAPAAFSAARVVEELEGHGFQVAALRKDFFLPITLHRRLGMPRLSGVIERVCRALGLVRLFGAPVTAKAVRHAPRSLSER